MLDLLIYRETAPIAGDAGGDGSGEHEIQICGKTCLAGDIFGQLRLARPLRVGDRLSIGDAGGYTMVKKNWFNGVRMPSIVIRELDGSERVVREFSYDEYVRSLS